MDDIRLNTVNMDKRGVLRGKKPCFYVQIHYLQVLDIISSFKCWVSFLYRDKTGTKLVGYRL